MMQTRMPQDPQHCQHRQQLQDLLFSVIGWYDMIQVEYISLGDDRFFNWSTTNTRLLVKKL
ncbi:hypothetical protein HanRHA438_Chr17g0815701 [Helianthus annuus]|nr:hypothetical protein HanHA89_Chr17g0708771 [Helianthus annuus]KAJ0632637.1 hypothetical protein HanLR1_Chr17g0667381 [Helianthus annuus]KAJ0826559.1 hypothetical protein HanRHA438_Chr17g0815701 [Helianthus annuus]